MLTETAVEPLPLALWGRDGTATWYEAIEVDNRQIVPRAEHASVQSAWGVGRSVHLIQTLTIQVCNLLPDVFQALPQECL
jgi:hypothetical protein